MKQPAHHIFRLQSGRTTTRWWRSRSRSCNCAVSACDGDVLMMSAVVMSPRTMWTISNESLTALTFDTVQPDLPTSGTIPVVDHQTNVSTQVTVNSFRRIYHLINQTVIRYTTFISDRNQSVYQQLLFVTHNTIHTTKCTKENLNTVWQVARRELNVPLYLLPCMKQENHQEMKWRTWTSLRRHRTHTAKYNRLVLKFPPQIDAVMCWNTGLPNSVK